MCNALLPVRHGGQSLDLRPVPRGGAMGWGRDTPLHCLDGDSHLVDEHREQGLVLLREAHGSGSIGVLVQFRFIDHLDHPEGCILLPDDWHAEDRFRAVARLFVHAAVEAGVFIHIGYIHPAAALEHLARDALGGGHNDGGGVFVGDVHPLFHVILMIVRLVVHDAGVEFVGGRVQEEQRAPISPEQSSHGTERLRNVHVHLGMHVVREKHLDRVHEFGKFFEDRRGRSAVLLDFFLDVVVDLAM